MFIIRTKWFENDLASLCYSDVHTVNSNSGCKASWCDVRQKNKLSLNHCGVVPKKFEIEYSIK